MSSLTGLRGLFSMSKGAASVEHEVEEVKEVAAVAKPGLLGRMWGGAGATANVAGSAFGAVGKVAEVAAGAAGVGLAIEEFSQIEKFMKFVMECVEDPKHIGQHFKEMLGITTPDAADNTATPNARADAAPAVNGQGNHLPGAPSPGIGVEPVSANIHLPGQGADKAIAVDAKTLSHGSFENVIGGTLKYAGALGMAALPAGAIIETQMRSKNGSLMHQNVEVLDKDHYRILPGDDGLSQFKKPDGFDTPGYAAKRQSELGEISKATAGGSRATGVVSINEGLVGAGATRTFTQGSTVAFASRMDQGTREGVSVAMAGMGSKMGVTDYESGFFRTGSSKPTIAQFEFDGHAGVSKLGFVDNSGAGNQSLEFVKSKDGRNMIQARDSADGVERMAVSSAKGGRLTLSGEGVLNLDGDGRGAARRVGAAVTTKTELEGISGPGVKSSVIMLDGEKGSVQFVEKGDRGVAIADGRVIKFEKGKDGAWLAETDKAEGLKLDHKTGAAVIPGDVASGISSFMKGEGADTVKSAGRAGVINSAMSPLQRVMALADQKTDEHAAGSLASLTPARAPAGRGLGD